MKPFRIVLFASIAAFSFAGSAFAQDKLRLITWADYVPADVVAQFKKETGIDVEITLSNNEEMISKLRATGGAGFDLAQPSQDRIAGPQQETQIVANLAGVGSGRREHRSEHTGQRQLPQNVHLLVLLRSFRPA